MFKYPADYAGKILQHSIWFLDLVCLVNFLKLNLMLVELHGDDIGWGDKRVGAVINCAPPASLQYIGNLYFRRSKKGAYNKGNQISILMIAME